MADHLGDFGTPREPLDATFGWLGETLRLSPSLTDLAILDLAEMLTGLDDSGDQAVSAVRSIGAILVHPDDVDRFWQIARTGSQTMADIGELAATLIAAVADRPTRRPSDSSDGSPTTEPKSPADSSSPAIATLSGRPDLQVAVARAEAQRAS